MAGSDSDDETVDYSSYNDDPRIACKYGSKCYQKNPLHQEKYKHPPKRDSNNEFEDGARKKPRLDEQVDDVERSDDTAANIERTEQSAFRESHEETTTGNNCGEGDMPASPEDVKASIKQKFLVDMPEDFYSFWSFCKSLKKDKPSEALKDVGLLLVGPFDVLSGELKNFRPRKKSLYLRHWRYYYDPPEFQTVVKGDDTKQFHMGYYRDDPKEPPAFVASNSAAVDCIITPVARNIFGAVNCHLESYKSKCDPFRKMKVASLQKALLTWSTQESIDVSVSTSEMRNRARKVVAKTFHKGGIVVPVNKQTGYRPLFESEAQIKRMMQNYADSDSETQRSQLMDKLQTVITAANIANDECDFGTSLELGLDFFSFGGEMFHRMALQLLCTAYSLLQREEFAEIAKSHLEDRRKGSALSIIYQQK